jgi:hypothetical protein
MRHVEYDRTVWPILPSFCNSGNYNSYSGAISCLSRADNFSTKFDVFPETISVLNLYTQTFLPELKRVKEYPFNYFLNFFFLFFFSTIENSKKTPVTLFQLDHKIKPNIRWL